MPSIFEMITPPFAAQDDDSGTDSETDFVSLAQYLSEQAQECCSPPCGRESTIITNENALLTSDRCVRRANSELATVDSANMCSVKTVYSFDYSSQETPSPEFLVLCRNNTGEFATAANESSVGGNCGKLLGDEWHRNYSSCSQPFKSQIVNVPSRNHNLSKCASFGTSGAIKTLTEDTFVLPTLKRSASDLPLRSVFNTK